MREHLAGSPLATVDSEGSRIGGFLMDKSSQRLTWPTKCALWFVVLFMGWSILAPVWWAALLIVLVSSCCVLWIVRRNSPDERKPDG